MLTGRKLLFVGGDARMVEVIARATELDASTTLIGFDNLTHTFTDTVSTALFIEPFEDVDALVLPIAGTDESGYVDSQFCERPIALTEAHFAAMRPGTIVFSGIAGPWLKAACSAHDLRLIPLMARDEVAILNSIPTAEGAIAMAMEHTAVTIHGSQSVVLGFGRCGQTLAHTLHALGANVSVVARDAAQLARVRALGLAPFALPQLERATADAEVVFNTIAHPVLTGKVLSGMRRDVVVVDIASKPGGTDFRYTERHGIKAFLAPSLPGLVAPQTAGRIIADSVCRILAEASAEGEQ